MYPVEIKNIETGKSETQQIPKFLTMFNCLQELNSGNFLANRKYITNMPAGQLKNTIITNVNRWTVTGNMSGRLFRCPYTRRRGPNTRNSWPNGCGIPGISGFSSFMRSTGGGRTGKVLLGVGALAGLVALTVTTGGAGALFATSIAAATAKAGMGVGLAKAMLIGLSAAFAVPGVAGASFAIGQMQKAANGRLTVEAPVDVQTLLQNNNGFMDQAASIGPVESGGRRRLRKSRKRKI